MARRRRSSNDSKAVEQLIKLVAKGIGALVTSLFAAGAAAKRSKRAPARSKSRRVDPPSGCDQEVAGEKSYQKALRSIAGQGEVRVECRATVSAEDSNSYDDQAVVVAVRGETVGYLPRAAARRYRAVHGTSSSDCDAVIVGGGKDRSLGIWLDLPL